MKKILFIALLLSSVVSFSQSPIGKGGQQLNFGLGFSNHGLPVYVNYDFGIHEDITIAPQVQFNLDGLDYMILGAKGDYHFNTIMNIPREWDFYAGANLGFAVDFDDNGKDDFKGLDGGIQVGGRWYWSEKWGMNLEFAGGRGFGGKFGLSLRM